MLVHRMAPLRAELTRRLAALGIRTELESREDSEACSAKFGTDVNGLNHKDFRPEDV